MPGAKPVVPDDWRERTIVSVPIAGAIVADLSVNASYAAAARGDLPVIRIGGRLACPVAKLRRLLGELPQVGDAA